MTALTIIVNIVLIIVAIILILTVLMQQGQRQGDDELRHRVGVLEGDVEDGDAVLVAILQINAVAAGAVNGDDLQFGGSLQYLPGEFQVAVDDGMDPGQIIPVVDDLSPALQQSQGLWVDALTEKYLHAYLPTAQMMEISTGAFPGREATPTAARLPMPASPSSSQKYSLA